MRYAFLLFILFAYHLAHGQSDTIIRYPNGHIKYIQTCRDKALIKNISLTYTGDTIYEWDTRKAELAEYSFLGEYLLRSEYDSLMKESVKGSVFLQVEKELRRNTKAQPTPEIMEWRSMHDTFFTKCPDYAHIVYEGPFTIRIENKNLVSSGLYQKFYKNKLVVSGHYKDGNKIGIWKYTPYYFYPYYDVTFFDYAGREWSFIYSVLPAFISIILLIVFGQLAIKKRRYHFYYYAVVIKAFLFLFLRLYISFTRENALIRFLIPSLWFIMWHSMIVLSTLNLFWGRKTKTNWFINILCLLVGLIFSIYVVFFKHLDF